MTVLFKLTTSSSPTSSRVSLCLFPPVKVVEPWSLVTSWWHLPPHFFCWVWLIRASGPHTHVPNDHCPVDLHLGCPLDRYPPCFSGFIMGSCYEKKRKEKENRQLPGSVGRALNSLSRGREFMPHDKHRAYCKQNKTKKLKKQKVKTIPLPGSKLDLWISFVFGKPVLANSLQGIFALIYCLFGK